MVANSWGNQDTSFRFLRKAPGSTTTDGAVTTQMVIDNTGNVGIGTTSPAGKLQVGALASGANGSINGASSPTRLIVNSAAEAALTLGYYSSGYGLDLWVSTPGLAPIYFDQRSKEAIIFRVGTASSPVEVMRINAYNSTAGNVTIAGTLTVNGNQAGAADHVFDDYDDIELLRKWRKGESLPFKTGDILNRDRLLRDTIIQLAKRVHELEKLVIQLTPQKR